MKKMHNFNKRAFFAFRNKNILCKASEGVNSGYTEQTIILFTIV